MSSCVVARIWDFIFLDDDFPFFESFLSGERVGVVKKLFLSGERVGVVKKLLFLIGDIECAERRFGPGEGKKPVDVFEGVLSGDFKGDFTGEGVSDGSFVGELETDVVAGMILKKI